MYIEDTSQRRLVEAPLFVADTNQAPANTRCLACLAFSIFGVGLFIFLWCGFFIALRYSYKHLYKPIKVPLTAYPGVSILKPLSGGGTRLQQNLETFFQINYSKFELLLCVHDQTDQAVGIVETLMKRYPHVDATLFITGGKDHVPQHCNPKIENLMPGYKAAKYGLILISDCSIKAEKDTLLDLISEYNAEEGVGIVWQLPVICTQIRKTIGAATNQLYFSTITAKSSLWWSWMGFPVALGSSCLIKLEAIESCGGLAAFGKYLAEDYFISRDIHNKGWKIRLGSRPALHNPAAIPDLTLYNLYARVLRWKRLRQMMIPAVEVIAPFTECIALGIVGALSFHYLFGANISAVIAAHLLCFCLLDWLLNKRLLYGRKTVSLNQMLIAWIMIQIASPVIHVIGSCSRNVKWRGRKFRLLFGGEVVPLTTHDYNKVSIEIIPDNSIPLSSVNTV